MYVLKKPTTIYLFLSLFAWFIMENNARAQDNFLRVERNGSLRALFTFPTCLPNCDSEDKNNLLQEGEVERLYLNAINEAKATIDFTTYSFSRGPIFQALVKAASRGIKVRGVVDSKEFSNLSQYCAQNTCTFPEPFSSAAYEQASIESRLEQIQGLDIYAKAHNSEKLALLLYGREGSGVKVPQGRGLSHNKFVTIDNSLVLAGSGNWSSTGISVNLENTFVFSAPRDPEVNSFVCVFSSMWEHEPSIAAKLNQCQIDSLLLTPALRSNNGLTDIEATILNSIQNSQNNIEISMHHFTNNVVIQELTRAVKRGVDVKILFDDDLCIERRSKDLNALEQAGAVLRYLPTNCNLDQLSHNKFGIFDNGLVINGSANWSRAGLEKNYEAFNILNETNDVNIFQRFFTKAWPLTLSREDCYCNPREAACREKYCLDRDR